MRDRRDELSILETEIVRVLRRAKTMIPVDVIVARLCARGIDFADAAEVRRRLMRLKRNGWVVNTRKLWPEPRWRPRNKRYTTPRNAREVTTWG